jgi:hypothetical protein
MRSITVKCPGCREVLEVDPQTGEVLRHRAEAKPKPGADFFDARLREIEEEKARREAVVSQGREKEKAKQGDFEKLFKKVKEEHAGGKAEKPLRPIDID